MRRVRNSLIVLSASALMALVAIGSFAMAAPSDEVAAAAPGMAAVMAIGAEAGPGQLAGLREEAAMVLVGTALIGVAAAVRRAA